MLMPMAPAVAGIAVRRWAIRREKNRRRGATTWATAPADLPAGRGPPLGAVACTPSSTGRCDWEPPTTRCPRMRGCRTGQRSRSGPVWASWFAGRRPGEEFGWRGYLQLRLCPARPLAAAPGHRVDLGGSGTTPSCCQGGSVATPSRDAGQAAEQHPAPAGVPAVWRRRWRVRCRLRRRL